MANAMILHRKYRNIGVQTGDDNDLYIYLTNKKTARIDLSPAYKEKVLSLNFGTSKSFIITKSMWKIFRNHYSEIDNILSNENN
jgi:hypothetical protein